MFGRREVTVNENQRFTDHASGIQLLNCSKFAINWKNNNDVKIFGHDVIVKVFDIVVLFLSILVIVPSFMSISLFILEL